jgi:PadR family transcriptional regulator, regulatory protein AphA
MNIRTLCLGILSFTEASGYEIKKEIEEGMFSHFIDASFGSIYPALSQLNGEGLVTVRAEEQTGRPDKKVYSVTEAGRKALARELLVVPARDKYKSEFLFEMLFKDMLPEAHVRLAIEKQLHDLQEELARMAECRASGQSNAGSEFIMGYGESVLTAGSKYLEAKLAELKPTIKLAAE